MSGDWQANNMTRLGVTQQDIDEQLRRKHMGTKKVRGRQMPKFPSVKGRDDRIADIRQQLADLYDAAIAAQERAEGMTAQTDSSRFPAVGGLG